MAKDEITMKKLLLILLLSFQAWAFPSLCMKAFKKLTPGELRYITPEFLKAHTPKYSLEIDYTAVSDQCAYGSCWLHARLSHIEQEMKKRTGEEIKLSRHYLIAQSLLDRIDAALESPSSPIFQGGNAHYADELVKRFGVVPDHPEIWKPRVQFEKSPHGGRLVYFLNARAAKFHQDAKDLTIESKAYLDLQDEARKDMREILKTYTGPLPKKFTLADKTLSPKSFSKILTQGYNPKPLWVFPEVEPLSGNLKRESSLQVAALPSYAKSSRESLEKIEKRIIKALQNGQSVTLSYENNTLFADRDTGIMSINAFATPGGFSPPPRLYRDAFMSGSGQHAVDIVGADLDSNSRIIKLKIKNSWGTESGDGGFYHMYRDYFENFVTSIYVSDSEATRPSQP